MSKESLAVRTPGWRDGPAYAVGLLAAYVAVACLPVLLAWLVTPRTEASYLTELGRGAALLGLSLLVLQAALAGRFRALDRPFGLDIVMRFHKVMGITGVVLLLCHPLLLVAGTGNWSLLGLATPWYIVAGKAALLLAAAVIAFALLFRKLGVDYQVWRASHKLVLLVLLLGFVHAFFAGHDLQTPPMRIYWGLLALVALLIVGYRNIYVPLWGRREFEVIEVRQETHDTQTIALRPTGDRPFDHEPGQFWFLKLERPGRPSEEHPFTISSTPTGEPPVTSTIKEAGNYTNTIGRTRIGDKALIEGPYGRYSFVYHQPAAFVFIAGGVGITPILAMLRCLRDTGDNRPGVLLYGNNTAADIIRRDELDALPANIDIVHVLAQPPADWDGPSGYVTADLIDTHAGHLLDRADVYLCGPPPMMDAVVDALTHLGVADARIHCERFSL